MRDLFLSFLLVALARVQSIDMNSTAPSSEPTMEPSMEPTTEPTEYYPQSTVILDTLVPLTNGSADPRDDGCAFEWMATLDDGENIVIDVCGFTNDDGDAKVDVEIMCPTDRWFAVGFIGASAFDENDEMKNVYAIVVPQNSRNLVERQLGGDDADPQAGDVLTSTVTLVEDETEGGMRTLRIQRDLDVSLNDLSDDATSLNKYYKFSGFSACDNEMVVIYGYAPTANEPFDKNADWFETDNSGYVTAEVFEVDQEQCDQETDGVEARTVGMVVAVVAIVVGAMW